MYQVFLIWSQSVSPSVDMSMTNLAERILMKINMK